MNTLFKMSNETYDKLKFVVQVVLPGFVTLWLALSSIWGIPHGEAIGATLTAVTAFLGVCLGVSTKNYNKEDISDGN